MSEGWTATVTLELYPDQGQALAWASTEGSLHLALRAEQDVLSGKVLEDVMDQCQLLDWDCAEPPPRLVRSTPPPEALQEVDVYQGAERTRHKVRQGDKLLTAP